MVCVAQYWVPLVNLIHYLRVQRILLKSFFSSKFSISRFNFDNGLKSDVEMSNTQLFILLLKYLCYLNVLDELLCGCVHG